MRCSLCNQPYLNGEKKIILMFLVLWHPHAVFTPLILSEKERKGETLPDLFCAGQMPLSVSMASSPEPLSLVFLIPFNSVSAIL